MAIDYKKPLVYSASDYLRVAGNIASNTRSNFVDSGTPKDWLALVDCMLACEWDITPDEWTQEQVDAAREHGIVPEWDPKNERPKPPKPCAGYYVDANDEGTIHPCPGCGKNKEATLPSDRVVSGVNASSKGWAIWDGFGDPQVKLVDGSKIELVDAYTQAAKALSVKSGKVVAVRRWV